MKKLLLTMCFLASFAMNAQTNTFTETTDQFWDVATNWSLGIVPTAAHDVVIPADKICKVNISGAVAKTVTIDDNGKFQINSGKSLTISDANGFINNTDGNKVQFNPGGNPMGTLIFTGDYSGAAKNVSAKFRLPANDKWFLISSPFTSATMQNYYVDSEIAVNGDSEFSLAPYLNTNATSEKYVYTPFVVDATDPGKSDDTVTGNPKFTPGQGYATKVNSGDPSKPDITIKGKFNTGQVDIDISDAGDSFNLLGNPYAAYIHGNTASDATNNVITENASTLEESTIWVYDQSAGGGAGAFVAKNLGDATAFNIAPLQGFFVKAKAGGATTETFSFKEAMRNHGDGSETFFKGTANNRFEIDVTINSGKSQATSSIRYIDNTSKSFDNGYDSSMFTGLGNSFAVYTNLLENNNGKKLAIQSLPNTNYENMVIPVGVIADANTEITFSAAVLNLPAGYKVFLEDRATNTVTRLDEQNSTYIVNTGKSSTDGRFFIHARTNSVLSTDSEILNSVSIYKTNNENLKIVGLQKGKTTVSLFNILGKQVLNTSFEASNLNNIALPKLAKGVYVVKLQAENGKLNKKIILE